MRRGSGSSSARARRAGAAQAANVESTVRKATVVLVTLLLALPIAFGGWATLQSRRLDADTKRAVTLASAYDEARYAVSELKGLNNEFRPGSIAAQPRVALAVRRVRAPLHRAVREGRAADQTLSRGILASLADYAVEGSKLLSARRRGDTRGVARQVRRQEALADGMRKRLHEASAGHRLVALQSMAESRRADDLALFSAIILCALAPLLLQRSASRRRLEREQAESERRRLELAALTDSLTGLRNHRAFQEDFSRELERRNREGGALSLMMIDLNGLKQVNDADGHQAGDELIKCLAECLRETMREADLAYRIGGDEFTVILPRERAWGAFEFAQRLRARTITRGAGVAIGITETLTYELKDAVIRRTDLALIDAKRSNRNTVIYSDDLEPRQSGAPAKAVSHHAKILATALARAVDAKDRSTRNHCETVSELCVRIGAELGLSQERLAKLRLAGLLHDVGKIGIADAILQKPGSLDGAETAVMRTHSQIGHDIMTAAELHEEADFVLHHHERMDGSGYPNGLSGDEIPLESRIILVADTFEAITSDRPYREGRAQSEALYELERHAGKQFDPDCVTALRRAMGLTSLPAEPPAGATVTPIRRTAAA
jgi:diguanylate cyclase (GGDEF)-like protein